MNNVIEFKSVSKTYPNFTMNDISFKVPKGYITGFIGPNGSGKTTSIKMLLNAARADKGQVLLMDKEVSFNKYEQVGFVFSDGFLPSEWYIKDLDTIMKTYYSNWKSDKFRKLLKQFKLEDSYKIKELSRGMSVKLYLSIALSHDADLLILDEPTSGLDPAAREEISEILQDFISDPSHSVFFSTHITSDLESIADYIVFILNGRIIYEGEKDLLLEKYVVVKGGLEDLEHLDPSTLIGLKKQNTHFEALMLKEGDIKENLTLETSNLDDLIKFYNREDNNAKTF